VNKTPSGGTRAPVRASIPILAAMFMD
jgi:hypothetical protein